MALPNLASVSHLADAKRWRPAVGLGTRVLPGAPLSQPQWRCQEIDADGSGGQRPGALQWPADLQWTPGGEQIVG